MKIGINGNKFVATGDVALLGGHAREAADTGVDAYWLAQHPAGALDALTALAIIGRDPERNPDPDTFSVARARKEYAAFGGGLHHCLGLHLG